MKNKWIHFTHHAIKRLRERGISKRLVISVLKRLTEIPHEEYIVLVTPSILDRKFGVDRLVDESLFIVAECNCVITCFFCPNEPNALRFSKHKGKKIYVVS
ncbi:MAG TPA: hypothetical protein VNJ07_05695 [Chitinophagales bacterium]|nr:hypothetical protein [Chitinophagales bacterium]